MSLHGYSTIGISRCRGAIGASLRYSVQSSFEPDSGPYATAGVNLLGSLLLGIYFWCYRGWYRIERGGDGCFCYGSPWFIHNNVAFAIDYLEFSEESHSTAFAYALVTIIGSIGLAWVGYRTTLELMS